MSSLAIRAPSKGLKAAGLVYSTSITRTTSCLNRSVLPNHSQLLSRITLGSRPYSTFQEESGSRVSTIFTGLILIGIGVTSYGLYEFYSTFTTWPKELRGDLRSAVKAEYQGELKISEAYFRRAWEKAQGLPPEKLGGEHHLKVSGIGIALAAVLEKQKNLHGAYEIYARAFADIIRAPLPPAPAPILSGPERMRAVGLSMKLAELASRFGQKEDEERYLVFGVEEVLRMVKEESESAPTPSSQISELQEPKQELSLPTWDDKIPLYLQAISILLPPSKSTSRAPSITDRCRGAMLMNNLAEIFATPTSSKKANLEQATAWAKKGLAVAQKARSEIKPNADKKAPDDPTSICESVLAVLVYNLGMLSEKKDDIKGAQAFFKQALQQSANAGFEEGRVEAEKALARTSST
ncbi:TPR-2 domain protein [Ceratobasidium sp. AG-Ba]|nr:TPR-2 domain protein [Ceratobasidium sp. AG-Ba]